MRKITVIVSNTNTKHTFDTDVTTLGELKRLLQENNINTANQSFYEGVSKTELLTDDSVLPTNIPYKGRIENNLVIMMTTENKKIASGVMGRKELYELIKEHSLQEAIKNHFGKSFTNVSTEELAAFVCDVLNDVEEEKECHCKEFQNVTELAAYIDSEFISAINHLVLAYAVMHGMAFGDTVKQISEALESCAVEKKEDNKSPFTNDEINEMFENL